MAAAATSYTITNDRLGLPPINSVFTTAGAPVGTVVHAVDATYGEAEFIYLPGVASTVVGSVVVIDTNAKTTTLAVHTTAARGQVGVAMSANNATTSYGWYQISGANPNVVATGGTAGTSAFCTSTAGSIDTAVVDTDRIDGCEVTVSASGGYVGVQLSRPSANGNGETTIN